MFKKIVLTVAAASLFVIPSVALSCMDCADMTNLLQNAETDDLAMISAYDQDVVQGGNVALGKKVKNSKQNIKGDNLDLTMAYATGVVQGANVIGGKKIKNAVQNAKFKAATLVSDSNYSAAQGINVATNCASCGN
ncbi:MAG: hypothetical protein D3921_07015 [Candidatus Electrothrix sp. AW1]|nr:hypothetical protein [Candidatus Electrothrix sp. AX1]MCI5182253.1 hypothetical protein [Candidatus Electrothrix gigas]